MARDGFRSSKMTVRFWLVRFPARSTAVISMVLSPGNSVNGEEKAVPVRLAYETESPTFTSTTAFSFTVPVSMMTELAVALLSAGVSMESSGAF